MALISLNFAYFRTLFALRLTIFIKKIVSR